MYEVIVIGAGIMGSAAARHLVNMGKKTLLVGAKEPENKSGHTGVFASHYDAARITRRLDGKPDWARFSSRSIERYGEIDAAGGIPFSTQLGVFLQDPIPVRANGCWIGVVKWLQNRGYLTKI